MRLDPNRARYHSRLAAEVNNLAAFLVELKRLDEAEQLIGQAIVHQREALKREPRDATYRLFLRNHFTVRANIAHARNRPDDEAAAVREAALIMERLIDESPSIPEYRYLLALSLARQAELTSAAGQVEEALSQQQRLVSLLDALVTGFPAEGKYRSELDIAENNLGVILNDLGRQADALNHLARVSEGSDPYIEAVRVPPWIRLTAGDVKLRNPTEALRLAIRGAAKSPEKADWPMLLAFAQHHSGDSKTAACHTRQSAEGTVRRNRLILPPGDDPAPDGPS